MLYKIYYESEVEVKSFSHVWLFRKQLIFKELSILESSWATFVWMVPSAQSLDYFTWYAM